jgi:hypothetical protein
MYVHRGRNIEDSRVNFYITKGLRFYEKNLNQLAAAKHDGKTRLFAGGPPAAPTQE